MKKVICVLSLLLFVISGIAAAKPDIIPQPRFMKMGKGVFVLDKDVQIVAQSDSVRKVAALFVDKVRSATGYDLSSPNVGNKKITLTIKQKSVLKSEGYKLKVKPNEIEISAKSLQGIFYGLQTLLQLLPPEIESPVIVEGNQWNIPCVEVLDDPTYGYRGMMLDVCRHFHDVDFIKKQLDIMAMFKMNRFHWHLTDDHLWTIEIKKYPLLTTLGSIRKNADGTYHRGYYTQDQIKEVVAYAQERFITVIPEVELPGHALAALTAYPEYSCTGGPFQVRNIWGVEENAYCPGNDKTFDFLTDIFEEVIPLFPGEYFHIGGDECMKKKWQECPKCNARMKSENLKNVDELQSYFVKRMEKVVLKHGKRMIGWDEILDGGVAPSATVMSWRGEEGGVTAANMGHDVIMTPSDWLYLDFGQGNIEVEPVTITFKTPLEKTYNYNPAPEKVNVCLRKHILGAQGNMWSEYASTPSYTEYMLYPRLLAVAELTWTPTEDKSYDSFCQRLNSELVRLDYKGVNYHIPLPEGPMADYIAFIDRDTLSFTNSRNYPMVYTLDGEDPNKNSTRYSEPLVITSNSIIKIATLLPSGVLSKVRTVMTAKESLQKAYNGATQAGVKMKRAEGEFYYIADVDKAKWGETKIVKDMSLKPVLKDKGAYYYTGYFEVPEDGVYFIATEMDKLYINNKLVLTNDGKLIRHSRNRTSLALEKGKHSFQVLMINNNIAGYPRRWNNKGFVIGRKGEELKSPALLSY